MRSGLRTVRPSQSYQLKLRAVRRSTRDRSSVRHTFKFPNRVQAAVREHVQRAVAGVPRAQFRQEPAYIAALLTRLAGVAYRGPDGLVTFSATNVDSVGPGAAESWSGADLAITAIIEQNGRTLRKAILSQAKLGGFDQLSRTEQERLIEQIRHMRRWTRSPKVMLVYELGGRREPRMASGNGILTGRYFKGLSLPDYFVARVLTTLDGDTRSHFVEAVQDSSLRQLQVEARLK